MYTIGITLAVGFLTARLCILLRHMFTDNLVSDRVGSGVLVVFCAVALAAVFVS